MSKHMWFCSFMPSPRFVDSDVLALARGQKPGQDKLGRAGPGGWLKVGWPEGGFWPARLGGHELRMPAAYKLSQSWWWRWGV